MSGCGCAQGTEDWCDDYEASSFGRDEWVRRTRKAHRCVECGEEIPVGSRCRAFTGLTDGEFWRLIRCLRCCALCEYLSTAHKTCVNGLGALEEVCDHFGIDLKSWGRSSAEVTP